MKRAWIILIALLCLALPASAQTLDEDSAVDIDLDADGVAEQVSWTMVPSEYEPVLTLAVQGGDGAPVSYTTDILYAAQVYAEDLDGDGRTELLLTGDIMSDDYFTYCLRYEDGRLDEVLFPDANRGESGNGYFVAGYGLVTEIGDNQVTLTGSQDVLGTWMASRTVTLSPAGRFEFCDDGLWTRAMNDEIDLEDLWSYAALTAKVELPYADADGNPAALAPGARLLVYASDKRETAWFTSDDGASGALSISPNYEQGWGWLVDGIPEEDCFEYVPYAD